MMDYKNIQELIKTVSESQLTSFEIETEGIKIKMEKKKEQVVVEKMPVYSTSVEPAFKEAVTRENTDINQAAAQKVESSSVNNVESIVNIEVVEDLFIVKSPIVGTMYSSSSPESENFVKVGSQVKKGDTLCILEAMKLMNEIESEVDGEVIEVLGSNEDMVEYGQPLFKIRKK
jgi:acetyl-CoA carboxylase biotin carboxyl carrier protein